MEGIQERREELKMMKAAIGEELKGAKTSLWRRKNRIFIYVI